MGMVFPAPVLADGQNIVVAAFSWFKGVSSQPREVVDAEVVGRSFKSFFEAANGGIHASNFDLWDPTVMARRIDEKLIQFREFVGGSNPYYNYVNRGAPVSHGHDGIGSSYLGKGAIARPTTLLRSFGSYMYPTTRRALFVFHGFAEISVDIQDFQQSSANAISRVTTVEIPYNSYRTVPQDATWRAFIQPYCAQRAMVGKMTIHSHEIEASSTVPSDYFLKVQVRIDPPGQFIGSLSGLGFHWIVTMQTRLWG